MEHPTLRTATGTLAAALALLLVHTEPVHAGKRPAAARQYSRPVLLADLPPCGGLLDLISEDELVSLKRSGLDHQQIAAVALIAHHSRQPVEKVAARVRAGESPDRIAAAAGLNPHALRSAARVAARDLITESEPLPARRPGSLRAQRR